MRSGERKRRNNHAKIHASNIIANNSSNPVRSSACFFRFAIFFFSFTRLAVPEKMIDILCA